MSDSHLRYRETISVNRLILQVGYESFPRQLKPQANPNPEIVRLVLSEGLSVVAVSGFEVRLALDLGFPGRRIFFNGNGKQRWELRLAAERRCVMNVDSVFNARQLVQVLRGLDGGVPELEVTVRLNVDIDTQVHPYLQTGDSNKKKKKNNNRCHKNA